MGLKVGDLDVGLTPYRQGSSQVRTLRLPIVFFVSFSEKEDFSLCFLQVGEGRELSCEGVLNLV